jgi:hypothetical protein
MYFLIEKGQSNNLPPPYTEHLKSQQGYNTQDSNVHQYTKENTQPGDKNTYVHGNHQTSVQVCSIICLRLLVFIVTFDTFCSNIVTTRNIRGMKECTDTRNER